jgi:tRNA threonylcarbamoyl adenosine modification protein YeaZ
MILAIDTATTACSVALIDGDGIIAELSDSVGRGHAEKLIPMIASLPGGGRAASILVNCGPGSFTGVRVGLAAARGLALGWNVPVSGFSTLALLAWAAFQIPDVPDTLTATIDGGHGELFVQRFKKSPFAALDQPRSIKPEALADETLIAGPTSHAHLSAQASLSNIVTLPASFRSLAAKPLYVRGPDAKPMAQ